MLDESEKEIAHYMFAHASEVGNIVENNAATENAE
jgi:hypothetical protein